MALIRQKHVQNEIVAQSVARMASEVRRTLDTQDAIARTGSVGERQSNGSYNAQGVFVPYLRLDVDAMDGGRGCAP